MLDKTYTPARVEKRWLSHWSFQRSRERSRQRSLSISLPNRSESESAPQALSVPSFCLIMPPPNVTGSLHLGHALTFTLQDIWGRFWRMRGGEVRLQPGLDHAGIATQMVVERQLLAQGESRSSLGREKFLERVWAWKGESGGTILSQLECLGVEAQWDHTPFTLDPAVCEAVKKVFVSLWQDGLIYKDKRLVNWDPVLKTAVSDLEVITRDVPGKMWTLRYPLVPLPEGEDTRGSRSVAEFVEVGTTRPETLFGDVAVAVHPEDPRYRLLHGRRLFLPLGGRSIPLIVDDSVDPEKGTGALKVTPAHDMHDFEIGKRHQLEMRVIFDEGACLTGDIPPGYQGLERGAAREKILADLEEAGLLGGATSLVHGVPHGDRSGAVLEPRLTEQWYLDAAALAKPALKAFDEGRVAFVPEGYGEVYARWMREIQPWCLSRQIWWGHPIPAWYGPDGHPFVALSLEQAHVQARSHYGHEVALVADGDVLDTWFSSALWPFVTLGWPQATPEVQRFYPSDLLITGCDILFFWVARMMMLGLYVMQDVPFRQVYLHGLLRDANRQKMSKTKGNVVNPLDLMAAFGTDSLRWTLASLATPGRDIAFDAHQVESSRNFITKLWNATRFCLMRGCRLSQDTLAPDPSTLTNPVNIWLLHAFAQTVRSVTHALEGHRFYEAAAVLYHFAWGTYCDWYVELVKGDLEEETSQSAEIRAVAPWVLGQLLHLMHPLIPFVTEELWHALHARSAEAVDEAMAEDSHPQGPQEMKEDVAQDMTQGGGLSKAPWPLLAPLKTKGEEVAPDAFERGESPVIHTSIQLLLGWISCVRSLRASVNVPPGQRLTAAFYHLEPGDWGVLTTHLATLKRLCRLEDVTLHTQPCPPCPEGAVVSVKGGASVVLFLAGVVDLKAERARQMKLRDKLEGDLGVVRARLGSQDFMGRAKPEVVEDMHVRLKTLEAQWQEIQNTLASLGANAVHQESMIQNEGES